MTDFLTLEAEVRTDLGKGASRRLRHANRVPAIIYGEAKDPISVSIEHKHVMKAQENEGFYSHLLTVNVNGEAVECILKDMQRHPFKQLVMHLDFMRIDANHVVHSNAAIHFINEDEAAKTGANISHHMNEIAITCLPKDLPEFIEIDLAGLELGQTLHLSDVTFPAGVTSDELAKGEAHDLAVVSANAPKAAKVVDDAEAPAAEAPAAE
jgi:large subunit ribosomal protein L25